MYFSIKQYSPRICALRPKKPERTIAPSKRKKPTENWVSLSTAAMYGLLAAASQIAWSDGADMELVE